MAMISFLEKLMSNGINLPVPYFCQRENKYIWQQRSSDTGEKLPSTKKPLAPITCNITSLCMILHYFGITDDSPDDMLYKIFDSEEYKNDGKFSRYCQMLWIEVWIGIGLSDFLQHTIFKFHVLGHKVKLFKAFQSSPTFFCLPTEFKSHGFCGLCRSVALC